MSELDVERLRDIAALREAARREAEDNARHPRRWFDIETELATYRAAVDALTADDWQALARLAESRPTDGLVEALTVPLLAEALFEARIGIPQDTPILAELLQAPLLRLVCAALAEADSAAPGKPAMSVAMSDADEGPA
jgi:hypothetical protein